MKPRLLDLFCGAGGAAKGYQRAGFHVVGVDNRPKPNYCGDEFIQADMLDVLVSAIDGTFQWNPDWIDQFVAVHASPPCQHDTSMQSVAKNADAHPDLIGPTRILLEQTGLPYVIENVLGAADKLRDPFMLCGTMFDLRTSDAGEHGYRELRRHRYFETNWPVGLVPQCWHSTAATIGIYGDHLRFGRRSSDGELSGTEALALGKRVMGIDWTVTWKELKEAIPPAYSEFVGGRLLQHVRPRAAA